MRVNRFEHVLYKLFYDRLLDDEFCITLWSALTNLIWFPIRRPYLEYTLSFRAADALINEMRGKGNQRWWYCSGPPGKVSEEISITMNKAGWTYKEWPDE